MAGSSDGYKCAWCNRMRHLTYLTCPEVDKELVLAWYHSPKCDPVCEEEIPKNVEV